MRLSGLRSLLLVTMVAGAAIPACSNDSRPAPAPLTPGGRIEGAIAKRLVAEGAMLLDVRTADEFADAHLAGSLNIPVDDLAARMGELPRDRTLVVYCRSGNRSARAVDHLVKAGYQAHDLGPMDAWPR